MFVTCADESRSPAIKNSLPFILIIGRSQEVQVTNVEGTQGRCHGLTETYNPGFNIRT